MKNIFRALKSLFSKPSAHLPLLICLFIGVLIAVLSHAGLATTKDPFGRAACVPKIMQLIQNGSLQNETPANSSTYVSTSNPFNPIVNLDICQRVCGSDTGWYTDIGPRLVQWFLPVFLLVSNMQFPRLGMERFFLIVHLLGDPIDSTWSLMYTVDRWAECYKAEARVAKARGSPTNEVDIRSLAVIDAARGEVENERVQTKWTIGKETLIRNHASTILRQRTNEVLRTLLAVAIYIFQVISAFVPQVGGLNDPSSNPSGGKIGPAMLLSWLVNVVLLSNAVGDLGSPEDLEEKVKAIRKDLEGDVGEGSGSQANIEEEGTESKDRYGRQSVREISEEVPQSESTLKIFCWHWGPATPSEGPTIWSGGMYCFQPSKEFCKSGWKLPVSILPVLVAFLTAFGVLEAGPTMFSCRSIFVCCAFAGWIISAVLTYALCHKLVQPHLASCKYLWYIILIKDLLVAVPILGLIVATSCGYWNTCYCWGGGPSPRYRNTADIRIQLNSTNVFNFNDDKLYPAVVGAGLGLQVIAFLIMLGYGWVGFRMMNLHLP